MRLLSANSSLPLILLVSLAAPSAGYAAPDADAWQQAFEVRRNEYIQHVASQSGAGPYDELARLAAGEPIREDGIDKGLAPMDARRDCADFRLHAILRFLYWYGDAAPAHRRPLSGPAPSAEVLARARDSVLGFKYWPDEPGVDSMCTWSENHHILFSAGGYLAGQLYPGETFRNSGMTGRELMAAHRPRVMRWLDLRFRSGFSEWLSNVYYDEHLAGVLSLADLCDDPEIRTRAAMVCDTLLLDMALNSYRGVFGSTHGRAYEGQKKWAEKESVRVTQWLLFGYNALQGDSMSASCLALSDRYLMPAVIAAIADDANAQGVENRQRMGLKLEEAGKWGLGFDSLEDGMVWLSLEAYSHPLTIELFIRMLDEFNWWENDFFMPFAEKRALIEEMRNTGIMPGAIELYEHDLTRNLREEVNIYTYRTPRYMLSTAQDYRAGYGGDQQHIWQATLGPDAHCFTTHPAEGRQRTPNYWAGSGWLPRAAQYENVVIVIYNAVDRPGLYVESSKGFTHAWLPRDKFDEVIEWNNWIFARHGDSYLALRSQHPYTWQDEPGEDRNREIIVPGRKNVYLCELGSREEDGEFARFTSRLANAELRFGELEVAFESPSQGLLEFAWEGSFRRDGRAVELHGYPRYGNRYVKADFPAERIVASRGGMRLKLDWKRAEREAKPPLR